MYLAHISEDGRMQSVKEHLENTAKMASDFAKPIHLEKHAYISGLLHDVGKYTDGFQKRLHGGAKVDHSTAGAMEAYKRRMLIESFCVAGHHSGLPNGGGRADIQGSSLNARIKRANKERLEPDKEWEREITLPECDACSNDLLELSYDIRMVYSCLVDADFLDTEQFMTGITDRGRDFDVTAMEAALKNYISPWYPAKTELNKLRCEILDHVISEGIKLKRGLYTLTVPTGGGKTVASLAFAIEHAKRNNLNRIIYVIPYTSIIEQTADIFREILGKERVLEHHSSVDYGEDEDSLFYSRATENWDMPVIVTTSVQFFESFYKNRSSSSRKLHNVANSVIVFDEAQMLPVPYMRPCILLLTELVRRYSASVVLCTATQPSLNKIIKELYPEYEHYELCPEEYYINDLFRRVTFEFDQTYSVEKLVSCLNNNEQYLCIVNSRAAAQLIYESMRGDGCFHLSTNMYPAHRKRVLNEIRQRLKKGMECKVVSTSLIEAGVDVDFPCVYRQISGLDSLLQAGGRCNREGKRNKTESIVHVFDLECGSPEMFSMQIAASKHVLEKYADITSKDAVSLYFEELFYLKGSNALDQNEIITQLKNNNLPFKDISDQFNLIENNTRTLYIDVNESDRLIEKARLGVAGKNDYRQLGQYGVNIYEYQYLKLKEHCAVDDLENGNCVLIDSSLYSDEVGLNLIFKNGEAIMI
ncbi:CRISPR-associated endonuclease/helicase Cas3 [[Clostridium] aminophilum]|uniref:CRISPR-associated endonuclease/helicase Cas3 n=1 Tax=[Clostridium] aminophilum TaxID=1526 RepID=A0A1H9ZZH3_9FIRM|nr:CRISPR-associated helicase/endonuclease Cas3 [[Clostridium] aminophilum]SES87190.1 CRISPR-associated endonuclease/helicase Cas3 [[Clostridium] aminophilum]